MNPEIASFGLQMIIDLNSLASRALEDIALQPDNREDANAEFKRIDGANRPPERR